MTFLSFSLLPKASPSSPLSISSPFFPTNDIVQHHVGLEGVSGAETIVKMLRVHRSVERLALGHNDLRDDGCIALFDYLRSPDGKRHKIIEISLNGNGIGDKGLWAITRYLEDNDSLCALYLQNGEPPIMLRFTLAINRSNLHILSLTSNLCLSEALRAVFFPNLLAPRLTELHLSLCSLGPSSLSPILSFLTSVRGVGLKILKLNGNAFGTEALIKFIEILEKGNWSLHNLEMYACGTNSDFVQNQDSWNTLERRFRTAVMERNHFLAKRTALQALSLLIHARPALLQHGRTIEGARTRLPIEIVMHVLTFLAPSLSVDQHLRVCKYAASYDTLPNLGLCFPPAHGSPPDAVPSPGLPNVRLHSRHTNSVSLLNTGCNRLKLTWGPVSETQEKWLRIVGCDHFEPDTFEIFEDSNLDWSKSSDLETSTLASPGI